MSAAWERSMARSRRRVAAVLGGFLVVAIAVVVYLQKRSEHEAYASAVAGGPCPAALQPPTGPDAAPLKSFAFEGLALQYAGGDVDCRTLRSGRLFHNPELPVCLFEHPGFIRASTTGPARSYLIPVGDAVITVDHGAPRCIFKRT